MQLKDANDPFKAHAKAPLLSAFGSISGVAVLQCDAEQIEVDGYLVSVVIEGWSPTLHRLEVSATEIVPTAHLSQGNLLVDSFREQLERQRMRSAAGVALGFAMPLEIETDREWLQHVHYDRTLLVISRSHGWDVSARMPDEIEHLHENGLQEENTIFTDTVWAAFENGRSMAGCQHWLNGDQEAREGAWYDGHRLAIPDHRLSETVLTAAIGRPVGSVAKLHPLLDAMLIKDIRNERRGSVPHVVMQIETDFILPGR